NKGDFRKGDILRKDKFEKKAEQPKEKKVNPIIGNYFFKIPLLEKVYSYELKWKKNHYRKGKDKNKGEKNTESFDYIDLKDQVFISTVDGTTGSPTGEESTDLSETSFNRLDVKVEYLVTMRVVNPYVFLFDSPGNSFDEVMDYLDTRISDIISQCEVNLLKRLKGSGEALWWGLGNPDIDNYKEEYYPDLSEEEFKELEKKQKTLWSQYKKDISYSNNVNLVFKGLKNDPFITERCHEWGIEIDEESIEIKTVQEPEIIKQAREEAVEKEAELTKTRTEQKMAKVEAETEQIKGQGERNRKYAQMRAVDDLAKLFRKYGEPNPVAKAIAVNKAHLAAEGENLKIVDINGLEGGSIANIAAQLGVAKELRNLFGGDSKSSNGSSNNNGKEDKKSKDDKKSKEKDLKDKFEDLKNRSKEEKKESSKKMREKIDEI
ncbi:MAG: hypothetical protein ACQEP3_00990, partial [Patescibacteria group bacterium]